MSSKLTLDTLEETLAVARLGLAEPFPAWASKSKFCSITRTGEEVSVVCAEWAVPDGIRSERGWRALKVQGPLDFGLTGILASLAGALAEAKISVFAISTFDTDYLLVRSESLENAKAALRAAGHDVH